MNNSEGRGVASVEMALTVCGALNPLIDKNDRTPITDGWIEVYNPGGRQTNEKWIGRVYVQVRAKSYRTLNSVPSTFPLTRNELRAYRELGGVLLFHVALVGADTKVYYAPLTPFRIDKLVEQASGSGRVKVRIWPLPGSEPDIDQIVRFQMQAQAETHAIGYREDLFGVIESFTLRSDRPIDLSAPLDFDDPDRNLSIEITTEHGLTLRTPLLGTLMPTSYLGEEWDTPVASGEVVFSRSVRKQTGPASIEIKPSAGILVKLTFNDGRVVGTFDISYQSNLLGRVKDLAFCLALAETGKLFIGETSISINGMNEIRDKMHDEWSLLVRLQDVLGVFGADASLVDLSDVSEKQWADFEYLHRATIGGEPLTDPFRQVGRVRQPIGRWALELIVVPGASDDEWVVKSLTDPELSSRFGSRLAEEDGHVLITSYDLLDTQAMERTINLNLPEIRSAYERIGAYTEARGLAGATLLRMIDAADSVAERRDEFLTAAEDLAAWHLEKSPGDATSTVNWLQIKARRGALTKQDQINLRSIRRGAAGSTEAEQIQLQACCSILLGDIEEYRYLVESLPQDDRDYFNSWPIVALLEA